MADADQWGAMGDATRRRRPAVNGRDTMAPARASSSVDRALPSGGRSRGFESLLARLQLAIISDTHMPKGDRRLPEACLERLRAADAILHAGDLVALEVLAAARVARAAGARRARQRRRAGAADAAARGADRRGRRARGS